MLGTIPIVPIGTSHTPIVPVRSRTIRTSYLSYPCWVRSQSYPSGLVVPQSYPFDPVRFVHRTYRTNRISDVYDYNRTHRDYSQTPHRTRSIQSESYCTINIVQYDCTIPIVPSVNTMRIGRVRSGSYATMVRLESYHRTVRWYD